MSLSRRMFLKDVSAAEGLLAQIPGRRLWALLLVFLGMAAGCELDGTAAASGGASAEFINDARIVVHPSVMVSAPEPGWEHSEFASDVDPADPSRIMVCSMRFSQERNLLTSGIYTSFDRGHSWNLAQVDSSSISGVWDPACAYGVDDHAVFVTLTKQLHVFRSTDAGRTWETPVKLTSIDRANVLVDHTDGPHRGRMYMHGNFATWIVHSGDQGRTWERSAETGIVSDTIAHGSFRRTGTILPDGTYMLGLSLRYPATNDAERRSRSVPAIVTSTDGGRTLSTPVEQPVSDSICAAPTVSDHSGGPFHGRLYCLRSVKRPRYPDGVALFVGSSDDGGRTWSPAVRAMEQVSTGTRAYLDLAVNGNGVVGLAWYDFGPDDSESRIRFTASLDGGATWLGSVPVSSETFTVRNPPDFAGQAVARGGGRRGGRERTDSVDVWVWPSARAYYPWNSAPGDYAELLFAGTDGVFHVFWIANPTGVGEMYTARITVEGAVGPRRTKGALAGLENVTSAMEFQFVRSVWDPKTSTISLAYRILNTSPDTLKTPLMLQVAQLTSDLGVPTLVSTNGEEGRIGTILDATALLPPGGLAPGEFTADQPLLVRVDDLKQLQSSSRRDAVHLVIKAYSAPRIMAFRVPRGEAND